MTEQRASAIAPPNIALVKYWGKRDAELNLPFADSISVCLDALHARADIVAEGDQSWNDRPSPIAHRPLGPARDRPSPIDHRPSVSVTWNGAPVPATAAARFERMIAAIRSQSGRTFPVSIAITTPLPPRIGLAGSAAAMAAVAAAAWKLHGCGRAGEGRVGGALTGTAALSSLARLGSGSACRSVPGGFSRWHAGKAADGSDSYAESFAGPDHWPDLRILLVLLDESPKPVSSAEAMDRCATTAPGFRSWVSQCRAAAPKVERAILSHDFARLAELSMANAMAMHALCLTASPPILYVTPQTIAVLELVHRMSSTTQVFFTLDAGPNPILFTTALHVPELLAALEPVLSAAAPGARVIACAPGPGAALVEALA